MEPGARVEVRSRYDARWARGFELVEILTKPVDGVNGSSGVEHRYRVRRRSDGFVLPTLFSDEELREERRKQTWWL